MFRERWSVICIQKAGVRLIVWSPSFLLVDLSGVCGPQANLHFTDPRIIICIPIMTFCSVRSLTHTPSLLHLKS